MSTESNRKIISFQICDNTFCSLIWGSAFAAVVALAGVLSHYHTERTKAAFAGGYVETSLPGTNGSYWTKPVKN